MKGSKAAWFDSTSITDQGTPNLPPQPARSALARREMKLVTDFWIFWRTLLLLIGCQQAEDRQWRYSLRPEAFKWLCTVLQQSTLRCALAKPQLLCPQKSEVNF